MWKVSHFPWLYFLDPFKNSSKYFWTDPGNWSIVFNFARTDNGRSKNDSEIHGCQYGLCWQSKIWNLWQRSIIVHLISFFIKVSSQIFWPKTLSHFPFSQVGHHGSLSAFHSWSWLFHGITFESWLVIHGDFHYIRIMDNHPWLRLWWEPMIQPWVESYLW